MGPKTVATFPRDAPQRLRLDPAIVAVYRIFLEAAEKPYLQQGKRPGSKVLPPARAQERGARVS